MNDGNKVFRDEKCIFNCKMPFFNAKIDAFHDGKASFCDIKRLTFNVAKMTFTWLNDVFETQMAPELAYFWRRWRFLSGDEVFM